MTIDINIFDEASIDRAITKLNEMAVRLIDETTDICRRASDVGATNARQVYSEHRSNFDSNSYDVSVINDTHSIEAVGSDVGWAEYGFGVMQPASNTPGGPPHGSISPRPKWFYNGHVSYGAPPANAMWVATLAAQQELYNAAVDKVGDIMR